METGHKILDQAFLDFSPKHVLLLFSGGHDSLCSTHYAATYLKERGVHFTVYHGNTGIGIPQTRNFVYEVCERYGWELYEGQAKPDAYKDYVRDYGFPGPAHHFIMYRNLKEKPLKHYVSRIKSSIYARENVLLVTGIRQSESKIRMGYKDATKKEYSSIWCSPLFDWSEDDIKDYMSDNSLPRNPVKDKICISGECLCGAFAKHSEWVEIKHEFPDVAEKINDLHQMAVEAGKPWPWASNPSEFKKHNISGQPSMFMCVGCEERNAEQTTND